MVWKLKVINKLRTGGDEMSKGNIILHTAFAIADVLLIIAEIWSFAHENVTTKWTGFVVGMGCCVLAVLFAKNVKALCKKE